MTLCNADIKRSPGCAPSVLITFINMMLFKNAVVPDGCSQYMFDGQDILQLILLIGAVLCIPLMLFGKPLYILYSKRLKMPGKTYVSNSLFCLFNYYYLLIKLLTTMIYFVELIISNNKNEVWCPLIFISRHRHHLYI